MISLSYMISFMVKKWYGSYCVCFRYDPEEEGTNSSSGGRTLCWERSRQPFPVDFCPKRDIAIGNSCSRRLPYVFINARTGCYKMNF